MKIACLPSAKKWHAKDGECTMIRVVLVDAMALVRSGIRMLLLSAGDFLVLGEGASAEDARRLSGDLRPDVLLLDRDIAGALTAIKAVKEAVPACDVVVLTNHVIQAEAAMMFGEGASGYVCKDIPGQDLLTTLRAIRTPGVPRPIIASGETPLPFVHVSPHHMHPSIKANGLTARERDILVELSAGSTDTEIARKLNVHEGTVKTHVRHILRKLGVRNRTAAIASALRDGLIE
jgi:DNA-binding NarL/FixJ family response regulator